MILVNALADEPEIHDVGPALSRMNAVAFNFEFVRFFAQPCHSFKELGQFDRHCDVNVGE
jgi:hypothetical protein